MIYKSMYNEDYYKTSCGELPYTDPRWLPFFESVAEYLVNDYHPKTVLDVGCAMGHLVKALRDKGVGAYGIDISEYAISMVNEDIREYCKVASALDPLPDSLPKLYDLIVTIEIAEHLHEEDAATFISNLCKYGDCVIFSSTSTDFTEKTHLNVQQAEYWAKRFAANNYYRNLSADLSYISPDALQFSKSETNTIRLIEDYERTLRFKRTDYTVLNNKYEIKKKEINDQNNIIEKMIITHQDELAKLTNSHQDELAKLTNSHQDELAKLTNSHQDELVRLTSHYSAKKTVMIQEYEEKIKSLSMSTSQQVQKLQALLQNSYDEIDKKQNEIVAMTHEMNLVLYSRGYKLVQKYYKARNFILPPASKRFYFVKFLFNIPKYITKGYISKTIRYISRHGIRGLKSKIKGVLKPPDNSIFYSSLSVNLPYVSKPFDGLIPPIKSIGVTHKHTNSVDIIICVHNAYDDVKRCIESVFEYTSEPYNIIIVDDGSSSPTKEYLLSIREECSNVTLIRNESGNGYTIAANMGLRSSSAEYCILLNSDTIVTSNWLDKMIACQKSGSNIGIVGPLSNTASWQSVPKIFDNDGDWAHNSMPSNISIDQLSAMIANSSGQIYPQLPLLNGFCLMIHRSVINSIGYLDEDTFGKGFGEEDDFNLRAYKAGFALAIADDTYIFHAQSKSYSDAKRLALCENAGINVRQKHTDTLLDTCIHIVKDNFVLEGIRSRVSIMVERQLLVSKASHKWEGRRILFLLPIADSGGGGNVIIQEAKIMSSMGIDVCIYNIEDLRPYFESSYPNLKIPVIYGKRIDSFKDYANQFDVICSTLYATIEYCDFNNTKISPRIAYYVQDFEPYFFEKDSSNYHAAFDSYTCIKDLVLVTKTEWNKSTVLNETGAKCNIIGKSVDIDLFRPRKMFSNKDNVVIVAMIRPESPRRAPQLTLDVLREIANQYGEQVKIFVFGSDPVKSPIDKNFWLNANTSFNFTNLGKLNKYEMASLLSYSDIFVDFSSFQAMGLTAMEAMACGCAVIVPENGGAREFAHDGVNSLVINTEDSQTCINALRTLVSDHELRHQLAFTAIKDMCQYYPEKCAYNFLMHCFGEKDD